MTAKSEAEIGTWGRIQNTRNDVRREPGEKMKQQER